MNLRIVYCVIVRNYIFTKFCHQTLIVNGQQKYIEMPEFYNQSNVFFLDEISRWSYIIKNAKQNDIVLKIDSVMHNIEKNNKSLKGALPDNYFSCLDSTKLASLLDTNNDMDTLKDKAQYFGASVFKPYANKK